MDPSHPLIQACDNCGRGWCGILKRHIVVDKNKREFCSYDCGWSYYLPPPSDTQSSGLDSQKPLSLLSDLRSIYMNFANVARLEEELRRESRKMRKLLGEMVPSSSLIGASANQAALLSGIETDKKPKEVASTCASPGTFFMFNFPLE